MNTDASYNANYTWERGTEDENGNSYGNTINTQRELTINGSFDLVRLYNHIPFLKKANDRFNRSISRSEIERKKKEKEARRKQALQKNDMQKNGQKNQVDLAKALPKNRKAFEKEITLLPDTTLFIRHGKNSKRLIISAKTEDGKVYQLKYKKVDNNQIRIKSKVDSMMKLKITVMPKEPLDNERWYRTAQTAARLAMMLRKVSFTYRNNYQMLLPGFTVPTLRRNRGTGGRSPHRQK